MKKVLKNLAFVAATVLMFSACSEKKTDEVNNFRIQRGTNVSHWLSQSEERGEARQKHIQEDDFARLDSLGTAPATTLNTPLTPMNKKTLRIICATLRPV